jgi:hypothetical protein
MVLGYCVLCKAAKQSRSDAEGGQENAGYSGNEIQRYGGGYGGQSVATSGGGGMFVGQVVEHQQVALSDTGSIIVRKLQIARVFHIST